MKNLRNKNAPPPETPIQTYLSSAWDKVLAVYAKLAEIETLAEVIDAGDLDGILTEEDIDTLAELNALISDATLGDASDFATAAQGALADNSVQLPFASQGEAEAGLDNTKPMTPLRVAQAIAVLAAGLQNNLNGTSAPGITDDELAGYSTGSFWIHGNINPQESYRCVDATAGAAVWVKTTLTADELATVAISGDSDDLSEGVANLLMTVAERAKLAGIEAGATGDLTGAEIATLLYGEADTNQFTDALLTKLNGIESLATADQSDAEIEAGYNNQVDVVTQLEAETGTSTDVKRWTPERVAQAIAALGIGGGGGGLTPVFIDNTDSPYDASNGEKIIVDSTNGPVQVNLPDPASADDNLEVVDGAGEANSNFITIVPTSSTILNITGNLVLDQAWSGAGLSYDGTETEWKGDLKAFPSIVYSQDAESIVVRKQFDPYELTQISGETTRQQTGNRLDTLRVGDTGYNWAGRFWRFPDEWDGGQVRFRVIWAPRTTTTGNVSFLFGGAAEVAEGDTTTVPLPGDGPSEIIDTALGVADEFQKTDWSSWGDFDTPNADNEYFIYVQANGSSGSWTATGDVDIIAVQMEYTVLHTLTNASQQSIIAAMESRGNKVVRKLLSPEMELTRGPSISVPAATSRLFVDGEHEQIVYDLTNSSYPRCFYNWTPPPEWDGGTIRFRFYWSPSNTDTGNIHMVAYGNSGADGELVSSDFLYGGSVLDAGQGTVNRVQITDWISDDFNGQDLTDHLVPFRFQRRSGEAADTFTGTAYLLAVEMEYSVLDTLAQATQQTIQDEVSSQIATADIPGEVATAVTAEVTGAQRRYFSADRNDFIAYSVGTDRVLNSAGANGSAFPYYYCPLDDTVQEAVMLRWVPPKRWGEGQLRMRFYWTESVARSAEVVILGFGTTSYDDNDDLDPHGLSNYVSVTDTTFNDVGKLHITDWTALKDTTNPGVGKLTSFYIYRDGDAAGDTYQNDLKLIGVELEWISDAGTDD